MTRAALIAAMTTVLLGGPSFAAGAPADDGGDTPEDEAMAPRVVMLPGSYVALPSAIVDSIRHKILVETGAAPEQDDSAGGGH